MTTFADFADALAALPLAAPPVMDGPTLLRLASRALHILCAIILGGGVFYLRSVLAHSRPNVYFADRRAAWARWVAIASTVLIATGLFNYISIVRAAKAAGAPMTMTYHSLFGTKFLLAIVVMFIAALVAGKTSAADKARANISLWLNIAWICVMAIAILGAMMRLFHAP
jgi:hypothetical protein